MGKERDEYIRASLALMLIPEVGAYRIKMMLDHAGSPMKLFSRNWRELAGIKKVGPAVAHSVCSFRDWASVDQIMSTTDKHHLTMLTPFDDDYPYRLKQISDPPPVLWVRGDPHILTRSFLAVVGTRRPSSEGRNATIKITRELAENTGLAIVSGLAHGVDTIAHRITLEAGGDTVAVLGCGADRIYPTSNFRLVHQILQQGGAVISEFPPGTKPEAHHFPIRNRVVSGMSLGVLVTETGMRGGSRITAAKALEQNREVFVVPHAISNPKGTGSNHLIMNSCGKLVTCASDILEEFPGVEIKYREDKGRENSNIKNGGPRDIRLRLPDNAQHPDTPALTDLEKRVCSLLSGNTMHSDELSQMLQLKAENLLSVLLKLELADLIIQMPGKKFTRKP